jgi:hypothetical protein
MTPAMSAQDAELTSHALWRAVRLLRDQAAMARWAVKTGGRHGPGSTESQRQAAEHDDELADVLRRHAK